MKTVLTVFIFTFSLSLLSQDTLTVMQYNLLNYGNFTSYCTESNNNLDNKDAYIKTIVDYVQPDIICVNEMSQYGVYHERFLDNVLNSSGEDNYSMADFIKIADSYLVNMMYFNNKKLAFHSHTIAQSFIRDIDVYRLYYKSDDLTSGDTAFVTMVVAHLKAGYDYASTRLVMVENAMEYISNHPELSNAMFMGDFNVYTSNEASYLQLTNYSDPDIAFNDPINQPGSWNNNYEYRYVHTQSTHTTSNGCASTGGMDDRFDFILISNDIADELNNVEYVDGSYTAVGQDGLHFNSSLIAAPENTSVPADVLAALYGNSDHLPVTLKLSVDKTFDLEQHYYSVVEYIRINNPVEEFLSAKIYTSEPGQLSAIILSLNGQVLSQNIIETLKGYNEFQINTGNFKSGMYFLVLTDGNGGCVTKKFIVR